MALFTPRQWSPLISSKELLFSRFPRGFPLTLYLMNPVDIRANTPICDPFAARCEELEDERWMSLCKTGNQGCSGLKCVAPREHSRPLMQDNGAANLVI